MQKKVFSRLGLLSALYLSQGIPNGFFRQAAPVIFREKGMSLEDIGLTAILFVPWAFKFIWAPLIDRYYSDRLGRRRSWIIPLQLITAIGVLSLTGWNPDSPVSFLITAIAFINIASAIQDAATDGFAVELLKIEERGWGNGIQIGSFWVGYVFGGGIILILHPYLGWTNVFLVIAGVVLLASIPVWLRKETSDDKQVQKTLDVPSFFKRANAAKMILIVVLYRMGDGFIQIVLNPMLVDMGLSLEDVGWYTGVLGPVASLAGAAVAGAYVNRLGRRLSLIVFGGMQMISALAYIGLALSESVSPILLSAVIFIHFMILSMATVAIYAVMMDWSSKHRASTDYTFQDCIGIFAIIIGSVLGGLIADQMGYAVNFAVAFLIFFLAILGVARLYTPALQPALATAAEAQRA